MAPPKAGADFCRGLGAQPPRKFGGFSLEEACGKRHFSLEEACKKKTSGKCVLENRLFLAASPPKEIFPLKKSAAGAIWRFFPYGKKLSLGKMASAKSNKGGGVPPNLTKVNEGGGGVHFSKIL